MKFALIIVVTWVGLLTVLALPQSFANTNLGGVAGVGIGLVCFVLSGFIFTRSPRP